MPNCGESDAGYRECADDYRTSKQKIGLRVTVGKDRTHRRWNDTQTFCGKQYSIGYDAKLPLCEVCECLYKRFI